MSVDGAEIPDDQLVIIQNVAGGDGEYITTGVCGSNACRFNGAQLYQIFEHASGAFNTRKPDTAILRERGRRKLS